MINEETKTKLQVMGMDEFADGIESQQCASHKKDKTAFSHASGIFRSS